MAGGYVSTWWGNQTLGQIAGTNPTVPTWLALLELDPTPAGTAGQEFAGNGYTRQRSYWTTPSNKTMALAEKVVFNAVPDATLRWFGVFSAISGGQLLFAVQKRNAGGAPAPLTVASNQEVHIPTLDIVIGPM